MKKLILSIFMSTVLMTSLSAQVKFMPKAGVSYTRNSISDDLTSSTAEINSKFGFVAGIAFEIPLIGDRLFLQPEVLFQQNGAKSEDDQTKFDEPLYESTTTLNYISVPILAKVKFGKFFAEAGPSFSYGIGGKYEDTETYNGTVTKTDGKVKFGKYPDGYNGDDIYLDNAFDIGLQIGVGVKISVIVIDLRYGLGFSNLIDKPDGYTGDAKITNNGFQLTVGVPLGGD
ncbi:MAG TPA: porin family protein [Chryseolinea sp.]|nr:porin family protein [Chryseolinea sp.]